MWYWRYSQTFLEATNDSSQIECVDPNRKMISVGKEKTKKL